MGRYQGRRATKQALRPLAILFRAFSALVECCNQRCSLGDRDYLEPCLHLRGETMGHQALPHAFRPLDSTESFPNAS
jgi:hypothetical protein